MANNNDSEENVPLRPFEADGIQELDNNLPSWWVGLFVFCTIFGFLYMVYVHLLGGPTIEKEYIASMNAALVSPPSSSGGSSTDEPTDLNALLGNAGAAASGKEAYVGNCAPCHGQNGEGLIGPNLTDKFWIHGGKPEQIYASVFTGYADKGMPGWGSILGEKKVRHITVYLIGLIGTNPAGAKAAQGIEEP